MHASNFIPVVAISCFLNACGDTPGSPPDLAKEKTQAPRPATRALLSPDDNIQVDVIAVQYADHWKYVGVMAFSIGTREPRLPDPMTEDFILVVREELAAGTKVPGPAQLPAGFAYQWLGGSDYHKIRAIDLSQSDEQISRLFGAGTPSIEQRLIEALEAREIDQVAAQKLLTAVRRINYRDAAGRGLLHQAAYWGHLNIVKALISKGADPNLPGMNDNAPISSAAAGGNPAIVEYLLSVGADVHRANSYGDTPLHGAVYNDTCVACAKILIAHGADPAVKNGDGKTPLELARDQRGFGINTDDVVTYLSSLKQK